MIEVSVNFDALAALGCGEEISARAAELVGMAVVPWEGGVLQKVRNLDGSRVEASRERRVVRGLGEERGRDS